MVLKGMKTVADNKRVILSLLLLLLLFLKVNSQGEADKIQVLEFQKDGVATWWTVAEYKVKLDRTRKMKSLTLCGRFKLYYLHSRSTFFQLFDRSQNLDDQLKGELWLDRVRPVIAQRWNFHPLEVKLRTYR